MKKSLFLFIVLLSVFSINLNAQTDDKVYTVAEQMPFFKGNIINYLSTHIHKSAVASANKKNKCVIVKFIVEKDGSISNVMVIHHVEPVLDNEALRVIRNMPKWNPGKINGKNVRVWFTLPVLFKEKK